MLYMTPGDTLPAPAPPNTERAPCTPPPYRDMFLSDPHPCLIPIHSPVPLFRQLSPHSPPQPHLLHPSPSMNLQDALARPVVAPVSASWGLPILGPLGRAQVGSGEEVLVIQQGQRPCCTQTTGLLSSSKGPLPSLAFSSVCHGLLTLCLSPAWHLGRGNICS